MRSIRARYRQLDPLKADLALALLFAIDVAVEIALLWGTPRAGAAAVTLSGVVAAIAIRRYAPLPSVVIGMGSFAAMQALGAQVGDHLFGPVFAAVFLLFSFGMNVDEGRARITIGMVALFGISILSNAVDSSPNTVLDYIFTATVLAIGIPLLGRLIRNRTRLNERLEAKARELRRERAEEGERAAREERERIAGELHDVVAHAMSAMVVQASAARRLTERDPALASDAFGAVESTGREALAEIRRLLGVLRRDDEAIALAPQPSLRHLAALVRHTVASGLPVRLSVEGVARDLPPGVDLTAYRLIQEALNGALEQGAAGSAEVTVRYLPEAVQLEVLDDGEGGGGEPRRLPGVRERVGIYGGHVNAGRRRAGGHAVRAELPVGSAA